MALLTPQQQLKLDEIRTKALSIQEQIKQLPKTEAPTSVKEIKKIDGFTIPKVQTYVADPAKAIAGNASVKTLMEQEQERIRMANEADAKKLQENQSFFKDLLSKGGAAEQRQTMEKDLQLTDLQKKINSRLTEAENLAKDYNATKAEKEKIISKYEENLGGALQAGVDMRVMAAEKLYNSRLNQKSADINAHTAVTQALQGNLTDARNYINQAVQDAVADKRDTMNAFIAFNNMNEDVFSRIDSRYANAYKEAMNFATAEYEQELSMKNMIAEYMLKNPEAGIMIGDSLDTARQKLASVSGGIEATADMRNYYLAVDQGYEGTFADWVGKGGSGANYVQVMQDAINSNATPEEAARAAAAVSEADGIPVDQATLSAWTRTAQKLSPVVAPVRETTISAPSGKYMTTSSSVQGPTLTSIWDSLFGGN